MALPDGAALPKVQIARAGDEGFVIVAGVVESGKACGVAWQLARTGQLHAIRCAVMADHGLGLLLGAQVSRRVRGGLIQLQQALDQVGVVLQVAIELGFPSSCDMLRTGFPGAKQSAIVLPELLQQELRVALSDLAVVVTAQDSRRLGKGRQHQTIPRSQDHFIAVWVHALFAA